jgi:hypothetical protein
MIERARHVPLRLVPWDPSDIAIAIEELVVDTLGHFDNERFWHAHPLADSGERAHIRVSRRDRRDPGAITCIAPARQVRYGFSGLSQLLGFQGEMHPSIARSRITVAVISGQLTSDATQLNWNRRCHPCARRCQQFAGTRTDVRLTARCPTSIWLR